MEVAWMEAAWKGNGWGMDIACTQLGGDMEAAFVLSHVHP